jgi:hypothetical protein
MKYNTKVADPIHYKNIIIWKATPNVAGVRYYTYTNYGLLRSDTLAGIKQIINKYKNA